MVLEESAITSEESTNNEAVDHTILRSKSGKSRGRSNSNLTTGNRYKAKEFAPPVFNTDQDDLVTPESIGCRKRKAIHWKQ
ncbi:hypothetical protein BGZ65_009935 [Modicella reniformis]|uniref:Uncharacterized protein n=1 Tax=Modicella reniformis TaxID=1440133 RepID=A0A9P6IMH9_9FUNG|nr:hypothetical protein BGZ65_009935 [Modicella reniformis]